MSGKVFIVDDDAEARIILSDHLSRLSIHHAATGSAGECLARLVSAPEEFSLIFMEVHLPILSGLDASTWIRGAETDPPRDIPIIAVTADERFSQKSEQVKYGLSGYLRKPVAFEEVRAILQIQHMKSCAPTRSAYGH